MVYSILVILSLIFIQDTSGHGALIEPPMRSVLWKYGFDAPINYNYMELYCGGFQSFQDNGGRCGVCGDALLGPYKNERGGKYDLGIIARSYPLDTTSIEVKVEIFAHHKGYFEFKLCPNDEAEVTQECLNRYTLMIEEGLRQGDPTKFYPPDGQKIHSLKVSIPPDIRCERCVLQWTYRAEVQQNWRISRSLILLYASKRHSYKPSAFRARNLLAALDYNNHIDRDVIVNTYGTIRYQRSFNKKVRDGLHTQRKLINSTYIFQK